MKFALLNDNPDILQYCMQYAYNKLGDSVYWCDHFLYTAVLHDAASCLHVLLQWGIHPSKYSLILQSCGTACYDSVFHCAAQASDSDTEMMMMLLKFNPQFLQDNWLVKKKIPLGLQRHTTFVKTLLEARKKALRLEVMCRLKIIQQLGYNPMLKVKQLKLPSLLKDSF